MSQENVEITRRLWLAYVRQDYEASVAAFDDAVELSSDPRAKHGDWVLARTGGRRCLDRRLHLFV
jgi:hypothetical protein